MNKNFQATISLTITEDATLYQGRACYPVGIGYFDFWYFRQNTFMMYVHPRAGGSEEVGQVNSLEELIFLDRISSHAEIFLPLSKEIQMD